MSDQIKQLAEDFHLTYERVAAGEGWETQTDCRVPFDDLPEANQKTMLAVCAEIYSRHIEQQAAEIERLKWSIEAKEVVALQELAEQQGAEIERLRAERRWIPVTERLPDEHAWYRVFIDIGDREYQRELIWHPKWEQWVDGGNVESGRGVTHWMPLPEKPE